MTRKRKEPLDVSFSEAKKDIELLIRQLETIEHEQDAQVINRVAKKYGIRRVFE